MPELNTISSISQKRRCLNFKKFILPLLNHSDSIRCGSCGSDNTCINVIVLENIYKHRKFPSDGESIMGVNPIIVRSYFTRISCCDCLYNVYSREMVDLLDISDVDRCIKNFESESNPYV